MYDCKKDKAPILRRALPHSLRVVSVLRTPLLGDRASETMRDGTDGTDAATSAATDLEEKTRMLRKALASGASRVQDFFRTWDADGSGEIDKREFRRALLALAPSLGIDGTIVGAQATAYALFDSYDVDGSGSISYRELYRQLRSGADQDLSAVTVKECALVQGLGPAASPDARFAVAAQRSSSSPFRQHGESPLVRPHTHASPRPVCAARWATRSSSTSRPVRSDR